MRNVRLPSFRVTAQGIQPLQPMTRLTRQRAISASFPLACGRGTGSSHTLPGRRASSFDFLPVCGYACVGFPRSPQSHTFVCSWGFAASPPSRNPKPFENRVYIQLGIHSLTALPHPELFWKTRIFFLFVATSRHRRLRVTPNRLKIVFLFCPGFARLPPCQIPNFSEKHRRLQVA